LYNDIEVLYNIVTTGGAFMPKTDMRKKILIVDDDEFHLAVANAMLSEKYEITITKSGKEALEMLTKGFAPNLILLDVLMPDMDGWETFNRIKAIGLLHTAPVVFVSSATGAEEKKHADTIGAADFIVKPFEKESLLKRIKVLIK